MSKRKSIENGRAEAAFKYVQDVKDESFSSEYKSYIKKLAPLIKSNGLGNAMAFVYSNNGNSNKGKAYGHIYKQLENWLKEKGLIEKNLLDEILSIDSRKYRYITRETMAILNWWRRFVDGEIS
jgi:CRISPR-associated protein Cmr5